MADYSYDDVYGVDGEPEGTSVTSMINWAGALLSLALLGGLGAWGWQLMVRDVSGVPVITALEGPMRVAPENPGGIIADHQGLAVNRIPAVGEAAPGADTVVLAPAPVALTDEDTAMSALLPDATEADGTEMTASADNEPAMPDLSATDLAVITALAELEPDLVAQPAVMTLEATDAASASAAAIVPASVGGVARSPRPEPRPASLVTVATGITPVSTSAAGLDVPAESLPAGTRLVQLGAFPTPDEAQDEWARIDGVFGDYMVNKRRVIQEAETGGKTFYRLRVVGFDDLSDARRFCAVLVAGDTSCIPVVAR